MRTATAAYVAVAGVVVAACGALVIALWPHRAETVVRRSARGTLKEVRIANAFGTHCVLEDDLDGHPARTPVDCWRARAVANDGDDDVLFFLGVRPATHRTYACVFDRVRAAELACVEYWPAWTRVRPSSVALLHLGGPRYEVRWIDRATGRQHAEPFDRYLGEGRVARGAPNAQRTYVIGDDALVEAPPP